MKIKQHKDSNVWEILLDGLFTRGAIARLRPDALGEYQFAPWSHFYLSAPELRQIADKLDELNGENK